MTTYDALNRVTNVANALAPNSPGFQYAYVDETSRLSGVTYPSGTGLSTSYSYFSSSDPQDFERLQEIKNMTGSGSTQLSKFDYTYNPVGTIATWTQQADSSTAVVNTLSYDAADQIIGDVQSGGDTNSYGYGYDPAGNRLSGTINSSTTVGSFNNLNQLTSLSASPTSQTVSGYTSGATTNVTVNAVPATITGGTNFTANVPLLPGSSNVVTVVAQPSSGSATTQQYGINTSGTAPTPLAYDANGNTTTDENGNNYQWDALNRLTAIIYNSGTNSGNHTEMAYDGLSRRVQIVERTGTTIGSGTVTSTKNYLWIGSTMAEERDGSNNVTKRFFPQGEQQIVSGTATPYYYTRDHLGSVREMLNSSGTIISRLGYDPNGVTTVVTGTTLPTFGYAGMQWHQTSGLYLTRAGDGTSTGRPYDSFTARFPSRDPLAEIGGLNLYDYVGNNPITGTDSLGLAPDNPVPANATGAEGMVGIYGYGLITVTCCRDGHTHIMIFEKTCWGVGAGAGVSTGVVTGMSAKGPTCDPATYSGVFWEFGAGPWGAGVGTTPGNKPTGVNEINRGYTYGAKILMRCTYKLIKDSVSK